MALLGSVEYRVDLHTQTKDNTNVFVWLSSGVWNIVYSIFILVKPRIIQMCLYGSPRECGISNSISILVKPSIIQMICMALLGSVEYRVFHLHTCQTKDNTNVFVWLSSGVWNIVYSISILVKPRIIQMCLYGSPRESGISCIPSPYLSNQG